MKQIFQDIIPKEKRSIRNIPLSDRIVSTANTLEQDDMPTGNMSAREVQTDDVQIDSVRAKENSPVIKSRNISMSAHNMDGIRPKKHTENISYKVEPAFTTASSKGISNNAHKTDDTEVDESELDEIESEEIDSDGPLTQFKGGSKKTYWKAGITLVTTASIAFFLISTYFENAIISINPTKHDVVLEKTTVALGDVKNEDLSVDLKGSEEIIANGVIQVNRKSTGTVVMYNAFNSATQKLVAGTRLSTPNGLVYKLKDSVNIPAMKTVNGKNVPGSAEVIVEASETGEKYNQGLNDFKIVAYKDTPRYDTIYGRSKTSLSSGFSGTVPNILPKDIASSTALIRKKIEADADAYFLKKATQKGLPFVYISDTRSIDYSEVKTAVSKDGKQATISIEAVATATLLDSTSIFTKIIESRSAKNGEQNSATTTDEDKEITYTGDFSKLKIEIRKNDSILTVTGTTTISSTIDTQKVKKAVSGLSKEQAIGAIKRLVELETLEIDIRPWWSKKLPSADKIEIKFDQ